MGTLGKIGLLRAAVLAALLMVAVTTVVALPQMATADDVVAPPDGAEASDLPTAGGVSDTLTTIVVKAVSVRRGDLATVRYRADDTAGGTVTVSLRVVAKADGHVVRTLVSGKQAGAGAVQVWKGRLWLRTGSYVLVAHAVDVNGLSESSAQTAVLRVLVPLPPLVPTARARRSAFAWAARRGDRVSIAVVDSRGHLYGYHKREPFMSASVVKSMLLVAYLRGHRTVSPGMRYTLRRMIDYSDNAAADAVYRIVGSGGLVRLAHVTHMRGFHATGAWITTRITAADFARFFLDMKLYLPKRHRRFATYLLAHVTPSQSWGIPVAAAAVGYRVYFKPGWLGAWVLANEAARLERGRVRIGLAVFTDHNPTASYGKETIRGVTQRLLHR